MAVAAGAVMFVRWSSDWPAVDPTDRPGIAAEEAVARAAAAAVLPPPVTQEAGPFSRPRSDAPPAPQYEPRELLVANVPDAFRAQSAAMGYRVIESLTLRHLDLQVYRIRLPRGVDVPTGIARLRARFPRLIVDADHRYDRSVGGAGHGLPASFARTAIGWTNLPDDCGVSVRLGMIDAGIDLGHAALRGAAVGYRTFNRAGREPGPAEHGTAVAALMVGQPAAGRGWGGLMPGAALYAANIFEVTEAGNSVATARGLLGAVDWLIGERVHSLNLSIAGPDNEVVRRAIERATRRGLVTVAAAGNWASATRPAYPAAYPDVIAVTAVAADRRIYSHANRGGWIDFAAPGVRLWTAVPGGGRYQSGTSFASPFVAVRVGAEIAAGHSRDPEALRRHLRQGTVDLGQPGHDDVFGWGLITAPPRCATTTAKAHSLGGRTAR